jgi:hypothetical protein
MPVEGVLRVLLALDGTRPNDDALRAVWSLLDPEALDVTGLYVEDEDLLRAATLPCLREVSMSGRETSLDVARLTRDMANEAAAARRAFDELAQRLIREHRRLAHHFRVARGPAADVFDRAAAESDFVLVTRALRGTGLRHRFGRSFARLVQQPRHVLFVNEPWSSGSSVVVLRGSDLALDYATRLAEADRLRLVLAVPVAAPPPPAERLPGGAAIRQLTRWDAESVADLCLREDARLLVLPELPDLDWAELLVSLMDRLPCSLLKLAAPRAAPPSD